MEENSTPSKMKALWNKAWEKAAVLGLTVGGLLMLAQAIQN